MPSPDQQPPLPRWEPEAFEHEPAHGYFARLAARNAAHSVRVFADSIGLNGRDFDLTEMLAFCRKFPVSHMERMIAATPTMERTLLRINGQLFKKVTDWSLSQPRICAACIGETRYYRNWWDLLVIGRCPIHDRPLESGSAASKLAWWYPDIGVTPQGQDLAIGGCQRVKEMRSSWDAYVLGRMGIVHRPSVPILDACKMHEAICATELLGKMVYFANEKCAPRRISSKGGVRYHLLCLGFSALQGGESNVREVLELYLQRRDDRAHASAIIASKRQLFGWALSVARNLPETPARNFILDMIGVVTRARGLDSREGKRGGRPMQADRIALIPLARQLDVTRGRLRRVAQACNVLRGECNKGKYHSFNREEVGIIQETLADLVSLREARSLLGIGWRRFNSLRSSGAIVPFYNDGKSNMMFRKSALRRLALH